MQKSPYYAFLKSDGKKSDCLLFGIFFHSMKTKKHKQTSTARSSSNQTFIQAFQKHTPNETSHRRRRPALVIYYFLLARALLTNSSSPVDDQGHPGAADPSAGAGKGAGALQGLLQSLHHVSQGQDAEREPAAQRLRAPRGRGPRRARPLERQQRQQSPAG